MLWYGNHFLPTRKPQMAVNSSIAGSTRPLKASGPSSAVRQERNSRQGKQKLLKEMVKFCKGHRVWLGLGHGAAAKELEEMEKMVMEELGDSGEILYRKQIAATLALNTGPGLIGVAALLDP